MQHSQHCLQIQLPWQLPALPALGLLVVLLRLHHWIPRHPSKIVVKSKRPEYPEQSVQEALREIFTQKIIDVKWHSVCRLKYPGSSKAHSFLRVWICAPPWKVHVLQFSAQAELWQTKAFVDFIATFELCARLRKCALVVCPGFDDYQSFKPCVIIEMRSFQKSLLVAHVYVRSGKNQKWMLVGWCRTIMDDFIERTYI